MYNINFSQVFPNNYYGIIEKHVEKIKSLIDRYDVIIFMARKAVCFYYSMLKNKVIAPNPHCKIISDRVLSYNVINALCGKKVAIVDDVFVEGKSINKVVDKLKTHNIVADIYIMAAKNTDKESSVDMIKFLNETIKSPCIYLQEIELDQLSSYITSYIEISMCPYNIDQPVYKLLFEDRPSLNAFFRANKITSITNDIQREFGIHNIVIHLNSKSLKIIPDIPNENEEIYTKIRFLYRDDTLELIALPFVLLPELDYELLDSLYSKIQREEIDTLITVENEKETKENKLKIIQYVLSCTLFNLFAQDVYNATIERNKEYDVIQFCSNIPDDCLDAIASVYKFPDDYTAIENQEYSMTDRLILDEYLSTSYNYLLGYHPPNTKYYNSQNELVKDPITIKALKEYFRNAISEKINFIVSNIIDIFNDRGLIIPSVVHTKNGILRAYRFGEIFELTKKGIELFAYTLSLYSDAKEDVLDKTEYEKLSVLFFKRVVYRERFFEAVKAGEDCFSIFYSKFGPRVSDPRNKKEYAVDSKSTLACVMEERDLMKTVKKPTAFGKYEDKYNMINTREPDDKELLIIAQAFACQYSTVHNYFVGEKPIKNMYVHSFIDFLTLLSIGDADKNKMLALMAEVNLILSIRFKNYKMSEILPQIHKTGEYGKELRFIDGITSGLWKYWCFNDDELMKNLFRKTLRINDGTQDIVRDYIGKEPGRDENVAYKGIIKECGELLYEFAYIFNFLKKGTVNDVNKIHSSLSTKTGAFFFDDPDIKKIRKMIQNDFSQMKSEKEKIDRLKIVYYRAQRLIDICDLALENGALKYTVLKSVFVIFSPDQTKPKFKDNEHHLNMADDRCVFFRAEEDKNDRNQQLLDILSDTEKNKNLYILYCNMENDYEGVFYSTRKTIGKHFCEIVSEIIKEEDQKPMLTSRKIIILERCLKMEEQNFSGNEKYGFVKSTDYTLENGYICQSYLLSKKQIKQTKKRKDVNMELNFGDCNVIQFGDNNVAKPHIENISHNNTDLEKLIELIRELKNEPEIQNDNEAVELIGNIEDDIKKNNKQGMLNKLKIFAAKIAEYTFIKVAPDALANVLKKILPPLG
jgi:hypothetical protein